MPETPATEPPKRRGRPPGPPKEPKEAKPMGRPTVWDKSLGKSTAHQVRAPEFFFQTWTTDQNFRKKISELLVDIRKQ
jgi:hypothetical protein